MKYYVVKKGRNPGIYKSWQECKEQVDGFKGAIYKSFNLKEEAINYLEDKKPSTKGLVAYVDGSFNKNTGYFGYGCVLLYDDKVIKKLGGKGNKPSLANMRNVAGEIAGSLAAIEYAIKEKYLEISIYYDYLGIEYWADGIWKASKDGTIAYQKAIEKYKDKIKINFIKVQAHSGNLYNDLADLLAKKAVGINE